MSHLWSCPSDYEAEQKARDDHRWGSRFDDYSLFGRTPYDEQCEDAARHYREEREHLEYLDRRREEDERYERQVQERQEEERRYYAEMERQREEDYYYSMQYPEPPGPEYPDNF